MLTELLYSIQAGLEAGKIAEGLYNGEHWEDVDRAIDIYDAINWEGDWETEVRDVLQCLESVNNDDRLFVKTKAWFLKAICYTNLGEFAKARQYISRVLNVQVDSFTLNKEDIEDSKKRCRELQSEIKRLEHPELQYYKETTRRQGNQHNNSPKKNKSKPKGTAIIVTTKQFSRGDLLNIIAGCDNNPSSYSEDSIIKSSPKELRLALQANGISISTSALAGFNTYRGLINYILEHTQHGKPTGKIESSKQHTAKQPSASSKPSITTPQEEKLSILRECSGEYAATFDTQLTPAILRFLVPNLKDWYSITIPDAVIKSCKTFGILANYLVSGTVEMEEKPQKEQVVNNIKATSDEQEYVEMFKEYTADGEISERDRKMLDKFRSRLGISVERARELEESCSKPKLTEDEQEYLEMYKEYAADGEISERDRKMLNKMRDRMGISEERAKELKNNSFDTQE